MMVKKTFQLKGVLAGAVLAFAVAQGAFAAEVAGVKFADSVKVAGKDLQLNGLGVRAKFVFKLYAAGLYLQGKHASTVDEVMKAEGPRRVHLTMMRDITSEEFGNAFMSALNNNVDTDEKSKIVTQISKCGEMFGLLDVFKKGDTLDIDWIPGSGTMISVNGKRHGDVAPDILFYNALLKIWLGDKPVDRTLKTQLLITPPAAPAAAPSK